MIISKVREIGGCKLPAYTKDRELYMHPIRLDEVNILPEEFSDYNNCLKEALGKVPFTGIGFLTIDSKELEIGETHRRGGIHIDNTYSIKSGGWCGNSTGQWKRSNEHDYGGLMIISDYPLCKGWKGSYPYEPRFDGDLSHANFPLLYKKDSFMLLPYVLYLGNTEFVHESIPTTVPVKRSLMRITLPKEIKVF